MINAALAADRYRVTEFPLIKERVLTLVASAGMRFA